MKKHLDTPTAKLTLEEDILLVEMKEGAELGTEEMKVLLQQAVEFVNHKKYYAVIDTRTFYDSTPEARNYYAESDYSKYRYADAFIVNSLPMRLLVNFYITFNKPKIPSKMFTNEIAAYEWLKTLKKEMLTEA
ncbi:MAG: hypothetical protein HY062_01415 [Bacteroidetes bacterium]|nr:hypothetical protein [Bacteroidota bacterium]